MTELSEEVVRKLEGNQGLDSEMRNLLVQMRSLLYYTQFELNDAKEVELIIQWKQALNIVKEDVFMGVLSDGEENQEILKETENLIKYGDHKTISEAFNYLKYAAQSYLTGTQGNDQPLTSHIPSYSLLIVRFKSAL